MAYNPLIHNRKSIRLKGYDYSQAGLYFITICAQDRELLFGKIENDEMILNDDGKMIQTEWEKLPRRFSNIDPDSYRDEFVVMPNHFHAILEIVQPSATETAVGATLVVAPNVTGAPGVIETPDVTETSNVIETQNDDVAQNDNDPQNDIVQPQSRSGATTRVAPTTPSTVDEPDKTVGEMMAAFKSITTVEYIHGVTNAGWQPFNGKLWQRNYYEHVIRNEHACENIVDYITDNPARWQDDKF